MTGRRFASLSSFGLAAIAAIAISGCRGNGFFPPAGPMNQQQANAIAHDPFPQNGIAPDELASRPPDYQQPLPEAVRNRLVPDAMPWLGR
ncbi:hypothetical protein Poly51_19190 [Rubripirellula tenax]|uniref:Membrane or secreted protein n=1 Tax=Rubripirellula tenax TaxID=2528015 RepID=A0A5C6FBJ1_9BACT|nr:membrane or secreted protein [Rubripirellula tenax]TWU59133.1 hypothetical protein Poly51_19190 [Rubripirellula tenax]